MPASLDIKNANQLLDHWIMIVREMDAHYSTENWKYRISGNVLELNAIPENTFDRWKYRASVVAIGQAIKALSCVVEKEGYQILVQSFPSLENPEIIASIRIDEHSRQSDSPFPEPVLADESIPVEKIIKTLAEQYRFQLDSVTDIPSVARRIHTGDDIQWYSLRSGFDNPFTWLNLGYLKETILNNCKQYLSQNSVFVYDLCSYLHHETSKIHKNERGVLQAYLVHRKSHYTGSA